MAGRPTKYTPKIAEQICKLVAVGVSVEAAAQSQGVSKATVYNWKERGENGEAPYDAFATALDKAQGEVEWKLTVSITKRAKEDWKAGAWWLERRRAERFAEQGKLERKLEEIVEKVIDAAKQEMDPDSHQRLLRKLARQSGED